MTDSLTYLKAAAAFPNLQSETFRDQAKLAVVTNFTSDVLAKFVRALSVEAGIYPDLFVGSYKQYFPDLNNPGSALAKIAADMTFIILDATPLLGNELFVDRAHLEEVATAIESYAARTASVVVSLLADSYAGAYGDHLDADPLHRAMRAFNERMHALAKQHPNVSLLRMERLFHVHGEHGSRDMRSVYAYDIPFTNEFTLALARECVGYLRALKGKAKKCLVLDLDNTLWGGVVGEVGPQNIEIGPGYPGYAYQNFQRALKSFLERGVILAAASRNNASDVDEVFSTNKNMVLARKDFGAFRTNWSTKSENLIAIAKELNIGIDALVFLDDDPANREEVRARLPEVVVPEMPKEPETFTSFLYGLAHYFTQTSFTDEDRAKTKFYADEHTRKEIAVGASGNEYLAKLGLTITIRENAPEDLPRVAQLMQKTNQFNLTTLRHSQADIERLLEQGASVFTAHVTDRFGSYGIVAALIITLLPGTQVAVDSFVMSCRAFGRGIEFFLMDYALAKLSARGYHTLVARYRSTAKNEPSRDFLPALGFDKIGGASGEIRYQLVIDTYLKKKPGAVTEILPYLTLHG